jgi:GNAT superfamily N-acetyltransferase
MPSIVSRDYARPEDLRAMQSLVQATWTRRSHLHIGDLVWQRYPRSVQPGWPTRLWISHGQTLAWAWAWGGADAPDDDNQFYVVAHADHPALLDEAIDWAEAAAPGDVVGSIAYEHDTALTSALRRHGYAPRTTGPFGLHTFRSLDHLPPPALPPGFQARSMAEIGDVARKVAAHRASWSRFAIYDPSDPPLVSGMTVARYEDMMGAWPYRPELDFAIEAPDGRLAASCTAWLDEANGVGLFEPVGVDPEFRRIGLSRGLCIAALHALKTAGATLATVKPRGDDAYPVPRHAYATMGFVSEGRQQVWVKQRGAVAEKPRAGG